MPNAKLSHLKLTTVARSRPPAVPQNMSTDLSRNNLFIDLNRLIGKEWRISSSHFINKNTHSPPVNCFIITLQWCIQYTIIYNSNDTRWHFVGRTAPRSHSSVIITKQQELHHNGFSTSFSLNTQINSQNIYNYKKYPGYSPDHFQSLINFSLVHSLSNPQILCISTHSFLSYLANKQTNWKMAMTTLMHPEKIEYQNVSISHLTQK